MKQRAVAIFLWYLRSLARLQLLKNKPLIIGITGSAGKTSTLRAIEAVLKNHEKIKVSHKANSETGIPLDILGLKPKNFTTIEWLILTIRAPLQLLFSWPNYQTYVVEMAIDSPFSPKNMAYLLKIVKPQVGVFLNARAMHSEAFDSLLTSESLIDRKKEVVELIALEKGKLIESLPKSGFAILNADDPHSIDFKNKTQSQVISVGQENPADIRVTTVGVGLSGTTVRLKYQQKIITVKLPDVVLPDHFGLTLAVAVAAGVARGMSFQDACDQLEHNFKLPNGRASLIKGKKNSLIIDSSYNASGQAVVDMLNLLDSLPKNKQKIAILGDMRELGSVAKIEHEEVAYKAIKTCNWVILVGPQMKQFALPILQKSKVNSCWFQSAFEASEFVETLLKKPSIILIKGSQNTLLLEIATEKLMANPQKASTLLCRRGSYWDKERQKLLG